MKTILSKLWIITLTPLILILNIIVSGITEIPFVIRDIKDCWGAVE